MAKKNTQSKTQLEKELVKLKDELSKLADPKHQARIYEQGKKEAIKAKHWLVKVWYAVHKSNFFPYLVIIATIYVLIWFWNNIIEPRLYRYDEQQQWVVLRQRRKIFDMERPPVPGCQRKITIKGKKIEDGKIKDDETVMWVARNGDIIYGKPSDAQKIDIVNKTSRFDFRLQPGLAVMVNPTEDNESLLEPALVMSMMEIYNRVSVDAIISYERVAGGISARLPFKYTRNTYLGGGLSVPFKDTTRRDFMVYAKINF